jgi:large subunit ribosomal protein LX
MTDEFTVRGRFQARGGWASFEKRVTAPNESVAEERTYAELGSQHRLRRTQIEIEEVAA